jgi:5-methylcytosine-specific restriction protein A
MKQIKIVLDNYLSSRAQNSRAFAPSTPEQHSIATEIPKFFADAITALGFSLDDYKIEGSYGAGNMALCPWIAIFDRRVSVTAQQGYYIVLLFAEDMKSCCLSLNQGFTSYTQIYATDRIARRKAGETARRALIHIDNPSHAVQGRIDLAASGSLGRGYEDCAILSFRYDAAILPPPRQVKDDLHVLLIAYSKLYEACGASLHELVSATESDYQEDANEAARRTSETDEELTEIDGPEPVSQASLPIAGPGPRYKRNPRKAASAFQTAGFKCEVDAAHVTFISRRTTHQYVEAHHLIPMKHQGGSPYSLDVQANIVALCPTCHRLLHHGHAKVKQPILLSLFNKRRDALVSKGIDVTFQSLIAMYSGDVSDDD